MASSSFLYEEIPTFRDSDHNDRNHLRLLLSKESRYQVRSFLIGLYFVIFEALILFQKPFLLTYFAMTFHLVFGLLFLHHLLMHFYFLKINSAALSFGSYFFDIFILIIFMKYFPQLSSFLLVLQLLFLFLASFDLSFYYLSCLGLLASFGISILSLSTFQVAGTQNILSLILFNLTYLAVIFISGQLRTEITGLEKGLVSARRKWKSQSEFAKSLVEKMPLGLLVSQAQNGQILIQNNFIENDMRFSKTESESLLQQIESQRTGSDILFVRQGNLEKKMYSFERTSYFDEELQEKINIDLIKDVTEVRFLEEQLKQKEKLAAIGQLAAGIAHEIRNPLAGISGSIQLLSADKIEPDQQKLMKIILKEIDRLNNLITEFLDYAKPEKKPEQTVDLSLVLEDVVQNLKRHPDSGFEMNWDVTLSPQLVLGFSEKLKQCFLNIVLNALQAMKDRVGSKLEISLKNDASYVIVSIKDNGSGMSDETRKRIFEPFYTTKSKGTGLGLALTHKILESHQARVVVESEIGKGTEFIIKFPKIK